MLPPANDAQETRTRTTNPDHVQPDETPIHERLERIGSHLRKNTVAANHGADAAVKVADRIYDNYVQSARAQDDLLKRASDDQRDLMESLSTTMIKFRRDETVDTKKFREELLAVMQQNYAADGDEHVRHYVETEIEKAIRLSEKGNGVRGSIHKWMTKDADKDKDSWLYRALAGSDADKDIDAAKNAGMAQNEQDKLYDKIANHGIDRAGPAQDDPILRLEHMLRDLLGKRGDANFSGKIEVLHVDRLIVGAVERGGKDSDVSKQGARGVGMPKPKPAGALPAVEADDLIVDGHRPSKYKKHRNTDVEDVSFHDVPSKPPMLEYKPKTLVLGHDVTPVQPASSEAVKPKYQSKLKTQEKPMVAAVRSAMNMDRPHPIIGAGVAAAPVAHGVVNAEDLSVPTMNKFDAQQDMSSSDVSVKQDAPAGVTPAEGSGDSDSGLGDVASGLLGKGAKALLPKAGKLMKVAGKAAAVLAAGKSVYDGVSDEMAGHHVENVGDIIPKGGLLNKLNPFEYAMNGGRYLGDKINKGYGAVSKMAGGSGDLGSDIYDMVNPSSVPKSTTHPNTTGDDLAKSSAAAKANAGAVPAPTPVIVHAPAPVSPVASTAPAPVVSGSPRTRESYFDRQMLETFTAL